MSNNEITYDSACVKDTDGALRHTMTRAELHRLYCMLCDFMEDCTGDEREEYRDTIVNLKTFIQYRMSTL